MIVLAWISIVVGIILFAIGIIELLLAAISENPYGAFWGAVYVASGAILSLVPGAFLLGRCFGS